MSRTKGAKDKKPRVMKQGSMANINRHQPGMVSDTYRINGPEGSMRKFRSMKSAERGTFIHQAINTQDL